MIISLSAQRKNYSFFWSLNFDLLLFCSHLSYDCVEYLFWKSPWFMCRKSWKSWNLKTISLRVYCSFKGSCKWYVLLLKGLISGYVFGDRWSRKVLWQLLTRQLNTWSHPLETCYFTLGLVHTYVGCKSTSVLSSFLKISVAKFQLQLSKSETSCSPAV